MMSIPFRAIIVDELGDFLKTRFSETTCHMRLKLDRYITYGGCSCMLQINAHADDVVSALGL